ncbi:MAG: hypothetical protein U0172_02160 [Nitrospiraceae bacterium]
MLIALWCVGCASGSRHEPPAWIVGSSPAFPHERFITGVGEGESLAVATERAYGAVAQVFHSEIRSEARDWEVYTLVDGSGHARDERRLTLDHVTSVTTRKAMTNVAVLDKWYNPDARRYSVLAGVARGPGEVAAAAQVQELDREVAEQVTRARSATAPLERLRALRHAVDTLMLREVGNADVRVFRVDGQGIASAYRIGDLATELDRAADAVPLTLRIVGDQAEPLMQALTQGLVQQRLTVVGRGVRTGATGEKSAAQAAHEAGLVVTGRALVWPIEVRDPSFRYARWCSELVVLDPGTGQQVAAVSHGDKVAQLTPVEAAAKAVRAMQDAARTTIATELATAIYGVEHTEQGQRAGEAGSEHPAGSTERASGACPQDAPAASSVPASR